MRSEQNNDDFVILTTNTWILRSVEELNLPTRVRAHIKNCDLKWVGELVQKSDKFFLNRQGFGCSSLNDLKNYLNNIGLHLGMVIPVYEENKWDLTPDDTRLTKLTSGIKLSVRSKNYLLKHDIRYVGDLIQKSEKDLLNTLQFNRISVNEIKRYLRSIGLSLGITVSEWDSKSQRERDIKTLLLDHPNLLKHVDELPLSVHANICLKNSKINFVSELVKQTETDLLKIPGFGRKPLKEIQSQLEALGLKLGMEIPFCQSGSFDKQIIK